MAYESETGIFSRHPFDSAQDKLTADSGQGKILSAESLLLAAS